MNTIPFYDNIWTLINNNIEKDEKLSYKSDDESINNYEKFNYMKNKDNLDILKNTTFEILDIFPDEILIPK